MVESFRSVLQIQLQSLRRVCLCLVCESQSKPGQVKVSKGQSEP